MSTSILNLRKASFEDLDELLEMSQDFSPAMTVEQHRVRVERELVSHETLLVFFREQVAGYLVSRTRPEKDDGSALVELHRLYIKPTFRRQGIGSAAVALWKDRLPKPAQVFLSVKLANKEARAFYQKNSFEDVFVTMRQTVPQ